MSRNPIRPPDWWKRDLYSFGENLPAEGWVWEFMRRAMLLKILRNRPVDAMNPRPDIEGLKPDYWNYYKSWSWYHGTNVRPAFLPPAVYSSGWPIGYRGQQYRIKLLVEEDDEGLGDRRTIQQQSIEPQIINIKVDLNRRDSVIERDFGACLRLMREKHPEPKRMNPRLSNWPDMHVLEVWDLRQFGVSWRDIVLEFDQSLQRNQIDNHNIQSVRNAYTTAYSYIDGGKWLELAFHTDVE